MSSSTESKRTKTRWSSSIALSKTQPATKSSKKKQLVNKKSNNKSSTTRVQASTSIIDTDVQTNNDTSLTAFLDDLVVANYNLKEHTKKLERDFNSLQQDVARLSEHGRQLRIELRASEATKGELSANVSVLQEEVSAILEESAKHQDHARRTSMDNKRLAAELRAAKTIADGAMERAEKAEAAVFDSLSSVELAETRIDELKTNLLRSQLKHEIMEKELKQLRLVEKDLATLHWSLDEKEKNLTDRNTQTHEWVPEWMTEMVDEHDGNLAAGATATAVETGMMTASSLLTTSPFRRSSRRSVSRSGSRLGRSQPQSQQTKTSTPLKSIETLGQAVVQHLVESGLLQSAINITAPSSLLPSNVSMQTSPGRRSSAKKSSSSSRKKLNSTIDDNSRGQEEMLMEQKKELAEKRKALEKKLKRENATLRAQLKQSKMKKMKVEKVQNVVERSKTKNKSSRRKEMGDREKGGREKDNRKEKVREKEREKVREKTREKVREKKRQKGKEKERQKETMSWPSRSRSSSASSVSSSSSSSSGSSSSSSQSRSSYSSSGTSSSGSSRRSGSSVSSIAESAITEGDALEMLRRFDSEFARVMATGDQREQKKQREERKEREQQSSMQSSMMQSSMQLSESNLNESNSMSIPRPESSPLRREKGNDSMMSSKIRSPNDKNTKKSKTAKRPNDKERRRKRKYKSLKTSKAAVRVYRSVGKKRPGSATSSSGGKWR